MRLATKTRPCEGCLKPLPAGAPVIRKLGFRLCVDCVPGFAQLVAAQQSHLLERRRTFNAASIRAHRDSPHPHIQAALRQAPED